MDSLTQVVLGASVGEAVLGKKIGIRAAIFGAIAGTIPDLDILASPWFDAVEKLMYHRSITHSILFCFLASPLFGYLTYKWQGKNADTWKDWTLLYFLGFITHALLDTCTTWGTQLLFPFSSYGFATYTVFVVDPHYTIPFLILLILALLQPKNSKKRRLFNYWGLGISTAYLALGFILQHQANQVFKQNITQKNIEYINYITKPTPMNIWLWSTTFETEEGYYTGFYSIFDKDTKVDFIYYPHHHEFLKELPYHSKTKKLLDITKGFYTVEKQENDYLINDLRFGTFDGWRGKEKGKFVFVYHITQQTDGSLKYTETNYRFKPSNDYLKAYFSRVFGEK